MRGWFRIADQWTRSPSSVGKELCNTDTQRATQFTMGASHFLFVHPRLLSSRLSSIPLGYEGRVQGKEMRTKGSNDEHCNILDHLSII